VKDAMSFLKAKLQKRGRTKEECNVRQFTREKQKARGKGRERPKTDMAGRGGRARLPSWAAQRAKKKRKIAAGWFK